MRRLFVLAALIFALPAHAVTMEWVEVGDPGNDPDTAVMTCCGSSTGTTGYGSVPYTYWIGKYEVTNAQYAEFLNAVAATSPDYS
jgi:formylglycine-generating enzyme required for sulfatase activity